MSDQRQIVITGASSGIGAALTAALAQNGLALHVCARREEMLNTVTRNNTIAFGYPCDVSQEEQVKAFVAEIRRRTPHVDALVNCAAILDPIGPLVETDSSQWHHTVDVILYGTYLMTKHIVPLMIADRRPRIINFAGGGAFSPFPNYSAYAVAKAAVVRLTENLALELAPRGITVNAVAPGFVATEIHQATLRAGQAKAGGAHLETTQRLLKKGAVPVEVPVACVKFLLSDQSQGLSGKTLSASFDPWNTPEFVELVPQINASDLYTLRRINLVNLPQGRLRAALSEASAPGGA
jgi:3-oxoacyl-[acyl-carrier protein] reductase